MGSLNDEMKRQIFVLKTAFLIAKSKRPYVEGEVMIKPSLQNFVELFEGESFHRKVKTAADSVTLSDTTVCRRTVDCANDISQEVISDFKELPQKSIALDESTDNTSQPQLALSPSQRRRARVLTPYGYLHPGKGKHSEQRGHLSAHASERKSVEYTNREIFTGF